MNEGDITFNPHRYLLPRLWLIQRPEITLMICVRITVTERHERRRFAFPRAGMRFAAEPSYQGHCHPYFCFYTDPYWCSFVSSPGEPTDNACVRLSSRIPFHSSTNHTYPVGAQSQCIGHELSSEQALIIIKYKRVHVPVRSWLDTNQYVTLINHTAIARSWLCWLPLLGCIY
jgi:hypothetical protein